jgi:intracellular sulfur oxidation DsrE/DsrF family protein
VNAGYEVVVAVASDKKGVEVMQKQVKENLSDALQERIFVFEADQLFHFLDQENAKEASTEKRMKGFRVKVEYNAVSEETMKKKKDSISKMVLDSLKKDKKE